MSIHSEPGADEVAILGLWIIETSSRIVSRTLEETAAFRASACCIDLKTVAGPFTALYGPKPAGTKETVTTETITMIKRSRKPRQTNDRTKVPHVSFASFSLLNHCYRAK
jgi:hypothetical protein